MKTISKRELNHQTAQVLAAIQAGEAVLVTERGVPRWRIEAVDASADPVERLRAQGRIRPASPNPPPWPKGRYSPTERRAQYTPADVDALYEDMREDRRCAGNWMPRLPCTQCCPPPIPAHATGWMRCMRKAKRCFIPPLSHWNSIGR